MNFQRSTKITRSSDRPRALIIGLLISLLLHLLVVLFFFLFPQQEQLEPKRQEPTIVRLIDLPAEIEEPQPEEKSTFEIDQQPVTPPPTTPVESTRKAERDQKVDREQAPEADDVRDQTTQPPEPKLPPQQLQKPEEKPISPPKEEKIKPQPKTPEQKPETVSPPQEKPLPVDKGEQKKRQKTDQKITQPIKEQPVTAPTTVPAEQQILTVPPLTLDQLLPNSNTLEQIARGSLSNRNRRKERENVAIGDEVWLNLEQHFLASFFRRLHDKIDLVWNYPPQARRDRSQGTLELLIIVDKKGELVDVDLVRTSGSDILDSAAIQAIYRASPFGPLPKRYPHDLLKIHANFRYRLGGRAMF